MSKGWATGERAQRMANAWAMLGGVCWTLGLIFAVLGVISEKIEGSLYLTPLSWYLLAIALFVAGISWYIGWAVGLLYKK